MTTKLTYMAINQYGHTLHGLVHPRKDLLAKLACTHAEKMYVDTRDGRTTHTGYVVAGGWWTIHRVEPWNSTSSI